MKVNSECQKSLQLKSGITFAIPAFNEEKNLLGVISNLQKFLDINSSIKGEIIVIDDGSKDATGKIARAQKLSNPTIKVIYHKRNLGLGRCIKDAIQAADYDRFMIIPGDNDMPMEIIDRMINHIDHAEIIMCYFIDIEKRSLFRNLLSAIFGIIYMAAFKIHVQYVNGPCIYPSSKLKRLSLKANKFSIVAEINVKLLCGGATFLEIPATRLNADNGNRALTLVNFIETISTFFKLLFEVRLINCDLYKKNPRRILKL